MTEPKTSGQTGSADDEWYGQTVAVNSDPLSDSGEGNHALWRVFQFKPNPELKKFPSNQELFNIHWQQIETQLWKDGLTARKDYAPALKWSDKKDMYAILIVCEPRLNNAVIEKPQTLQEIFKVRESW